MAYLVLLIFVLVSLLALYEDYLQKYRVPIFWAIGIALVLIAGLREVGIDPDSSNYEDAYLGHDNLKMGTMEYSFVLLSQFFGKFTQDVHALFLFYAFWGVMLKLLAIRKFGKILFLPLLSYVSYYFIMHECMQIRTGILSGLMLLAITAIGDGQKTKALILILIGSFFHVSALILLPTLFMTNKAMTPKQRVAWGLLIPAGYILSFMGFAILMNLPFEIPYISEKLTLYQQGTEKGILTASVNLFSPIYLFTILLFYYLHFFHETIQKYDKYYPLLMKYFALGIFFFAAFSFFPVMAQRVNMLFQTVTVILFADIFYTIRPKWASILIVSAICLLYLNYSIANINFTLFWKI